MKRTIILILALSSMAVLTGCYGITDWLGQPLPYGPESAEVKPRNPTIAAGATQQFRVVVTFSGCLLDCDEDKTGASKWTSSNPNVATVNQVGLATALAPGTTKIKAEYRDVHDDTTLTVIAGTPAVQNMAATATALSFTLTSTGQTFTYALDWQNDQATAFVLNGQQSWEPVSAVTFAPGSQPGSLALHPSGRWLLVGNRGTQSVAVFAIDPWTGVPTEVSGSPFAVSLIPMQLAVEPDGRILAIRDPRRRTAADYTLDAASGAVSPGAVAGEASLQPGGVR